MKITTYYTPGHGILKLQIFPSIKMREFRYFQTINKEETRNSHFLYLSLNSIKGTTPQTRHLYQACSYTQLPVKMEICHMKLILRSL